MSPGNSHCWLQCSLACGPWSPPIGTCGHGQSERLLCLILQHFFPYPFFQGAPGGYIEFCTFCCYLHNNPVIYVLREKPKAHSELSEDSRLGLPGPNQLLHIDSTPSFRPLPRGSRINQSSPLKMYTHFAET